MISAPCLIQCDFPSTRSLIVSIWQRPIQKNEMSSESFLILRPQLSTHNYLDGAGLRDIVKEYKAVISARFFCKELTPLAVKQPCITATDRFHFRDLSAGLSWEWLRQHWLFRVEWPFHKWGLSIQSTFHSNPQEHCQSPRVVHLRNQWWVHGRSVNKQHGHSYPVELILENHVLHQNLWSFWYWYDFCWCC